MRLLAEIALIAVAALGIVCCVALLPPSRRIHRRQRTATTQPRPDQLVKLERLVTSAGQSTLYVHAYLRPVLRDAAALRLAARGHVLDRMSPTLGRQLLGERLWEIVRPGRPFPEDRYAPGITLAELGDIVDRLEGL